MLVLMETKSYIFIGIVVVIVGTIGIITLTKNNKIKRHGIETFGQISRIDERDTTDSDGSISTSYTYYVVYETSDGRVEAVLTNIWQRNYKVGETIKIKYLPENPHRVIEVK